MLSPHESLDQLAQELLAAWSSAHGFDAGSARALVGEDRLAILIEGAFSEAERKLAEDQNGEVLLRQYAVELLNQICQEKYSLIQQATQQEVITSDISVNAEKDQVLFIFHMEVAEKPQ